MASRRCHHLPSHHHHDGGEGDRRHEGEQRVAQPVALPLGQRRFHPIATVVAGREVTLPTYLAVAIFRINVINYE
jgi:hypothetical protein